MTGIPRGEGANSEWGCQPIIGPHFPESCIKMIKGACATTDRYFKKCLIPTKAESGSSGLVELLIMKN